MPISPAALVDADSAPCVLRVEGNPDPARKQLVLDLLRPQCWSSKRTPALPGFDTASTFETIFR